MECGVGGSNLTGLCASELALRGSVTQKREVELFFCLLGLGWSYCGGPDTGAEEEFSEP